MIRRESIGWTVKVHHISGGMGGHWFKNLNESSAWANEMTSNKTTKIEFIRVKYKDRMNV